MKRMRQPSPRRGARKSNPDSRIRRMHDLLLAAHGPQSWWPAKTPFEVILGAYLTQNTTWKAVELSLANLRAATPSPSKACARCPSSGSRSSSVPRDSSPARRRLSRRSSPCWMRSSRARWTGWPRCQPRRCASGCSRCRAWGRRLADAILLYALGHAVPVADEYLRRIAERHQLLTPPPGRNRRGYEALVELTAKAFASDPETHKAQLFNEFHALTVAVGKAHCRRVAQCDSCPLAGDLAGPRDKGNKGIREQGTKGPKGEMQVLRLRYAALRMTTRRARMTAFGWTRAWNDSIAYAR